MRSERFCIFPPNLPTTFVPQNVNVQFLFTNTKLWFRYSPFWNATYFIHIPHFGTQPILFTFPILERNIFYLHSPFWNATYFIYIPHFGTQHILFTFPILERNLSDEKQLQCKRSFPTKTYRILERNLFYVGLYKTFFKNSLPCFPM